MLTWDFKDDYVGYAICKKYDQPIKLNLYTGNALLIFLYEYKENNKDFYQLHSFYSNIEHAKNCLGLSKNYNIIDYKDDYEFHFIKYDKKLNNLILLLYEIGFKIFLNEEVNQDVL